MTPNEPYAASPGTLTVWATPSVSTPSKPHRSPNAASVTAIFDAEELLNALQDAQLIEIDVLRALAQFDTYNRRFHAPLVLKVFLRS